MRRQSLPPAATGGDPGSTDPALQSPPRISIPDATYLVLVVPDYPKGALSRHDHQCVGAARALADGRGGAVAGVLIGSPPNRPEYLGLDRLVSVPGDGMRNPDLRAAVVGAIIEALRPRYTVFAESDAGGGDLGRRIAARLGMPIATNCWRVGPDRCCRSNSAGTIDYELPTPAIITMQANALTPTHAVIRDASILDLPLFPADDLRIEFVEDVVNPADQIPLAEAEFVLSGGNGVSDWALFRRLAARLGAAMGGSRVAVDEGHLPPDRQVGSTGTQTVASVYLAVGISGAAQHLQGIVDCESVISVNHDPGCDMTRRADLGIVGDADAIMHALVERLEQNNDAADLSARV